MTQAMKKTIAQQLNIKDFPFRIRDKEGNLLYFEGSSGYWAKSEYDSEGNEIYFENSDGYWHKYEYDSEGNQIYYKDSTGEIIDKRQKKIITVNGIKYQRMEP
jgi:YD repeat-containing protein